jgi:VanZ family protein
MTERVVVILAWLGAVAIMILSLVPGEWRPHVLEDKHWEHFDAYFTTGAAFALAYRSERSRVIVGISLSLLAAVLEFAQRWIPGRDSSPVDWTVSSLGAVAGITSVFVSLWVSRAIQHGLRAK